MEEHGVGDAASIREIISEVDADNVSFVTVIQSKTVKPALTHANSVTFTGWKNQL